MPKECNISIVVTAYSRREYYQEALGSLTGQVNGRPDIEVIFLKNFADKAIDEILESRGIRVASESSPIVGATLRRAIELCNGTYIAFLDDDDLFKPTKLARFEAVVRKYRHVGYYHNAYETHLRFREGLGALDRLRLDSRNLRSTTQDLVDFDNAADSHLPRYLAARNREQNLSSTVIHREVAERIAPILDALPVMSDTIMLVAGLISGLPLVFDGSSQTIVRRHRQNASNRNANIRSRLDTLAKLRSFSEKSGAPQAVLDYLVLRSARELVYGNLLGVTSERVSTLAATRALAGHYARLRTPRDLAFILLGIAGSVAPSSLPYLRPLAIDTRFGQ
jgi:glycosyltransferase involved in cell wall biosynthesis